MVRRVKTRMAAFILVTGLLIIALPDPACSDFQNTNDWLKTLEPDFESTEVFTDWRNLSKQAETLFFDFEWQSLDEAELRNQLRITAGQFEQLAAKLAGESGGLTAKLSAAYAYFVSAAPMSTSSYDDDIRVFPGPGWDQYKRIAWEIADKYGANSDQARYALAPKALYIDNPCFDPVYGEAYYQETLKLFETATDTIPKIRLGAFVVGRCAYSRWQLACDLSMEVYQLEQNSHPASILEAKIVENAIQDMYQRMVEDPVGRSVGPLLEELIYSEGESISERILKDGSLVWQLISDNLPEELQKRNNGKHVVEWLDLKTNRLGTTPGTRIVDIRRDLLVESTKISTTMIFWEEYQPGVGQRAPWINRFMERKEHLSIQIHGR